MNDERAGSRACAARENLTSPWLSGMRLAGILAFGQSLLFLVLWLLLCANVGAATKMKSEPWKEPELKESTYQPTTKRDPFLSKEMTPATSATAAVMDTSALKLQGIIYEPKNPSAMVNDKLFYLHKSVTLTTAQGAVEATAMEITKEHVVLRIGERQVELRLGVPGAKVLAQP